VLQTALNGSEHILGCKLNKDETQLLSIKWLSTEQIQRDHQESFTAAGQHVRCMLSKVVDFLRDHDAEHEEHLVWKVTFDAHGNVPNFEIATGVEDVEVLPAGLE